MVTLRPEATASIVRAYIQHKLYSPEPAQRFFMIGPMFRRERPQKGRYRQFYQIDAEIFGVASPLADAQLIFLLVTLLDRLRVKNAEAHINSLGCAVCRPGFRNALQAMLEATAVAEVLRDPGTAGGVVLVGVPVHGYPSLESMAPHTHTRAVGVKD